MKDLVKMYEEAVDFKKTGIFKSKKMLEKLATEMRLARISRGIKMNWVASKLDLSPSTISLIENGKTHPTLREVEFYQKIIEGEIKLKK